MGSRSQKGYFFKVLALLQFLLPFPYVGLRRPLWGCAKSPVRPHGRTIRISLNNEVMPCELST